MFLAKHNRVTAAADILAPTAERCARGPVERLDKPISDAAGRVARPYRSIDILAAMERRGSITAAMRAAGETFRNYFAAAHLEPLRAADLSRVGGNFARAEPGLRAEAAREQVWRAIVAAGGLASAGGSCLWHVVGLETSLKGWAFEQGWSGRRVTQEIASGILVGALGVLEMHFADTGHHHRQRPRPPVTTIRQTHVSV